MDEVYTAPGYLFRRVQQISAAIFTEECKAFDLTSVQYAALFAIRTHPGIDATRLSAVIAFDRSTIGDVMERLEAKAMSNASPARRQARQAFVSHQAGTDLLRQVMPSVDRVQARMLAPLKPADRKTLLTLLDQLVDLNNEVSRVPLRAEDALEHPGTVELMAGGRRTTGPDRGRRHRRPRRGGGASPKRLRSIVLEKASALGEIGAGIQLGPNAFHCFRLSRHRRSRAQHGGLCRQLRLMDAMTARKSRHVALGEAFRGASAIPMPWCIVATCTAFSSRPVATVT